MVADHLETASSISALHFLPLALDHKRGKRKGGTKRKKGGGGGGEVGCRGARLRNSSVKGGKRLLGWRGSQGDERELLFLLFLFLRQRLAARVRRERTSERGERRHRN